MRHWLIRRLQQKSGTENSYATQTSIKVTHSNGFACHSNIVYGAEYPNSFMDIWYANLKHEEKCPTYINIHGGGFFWGSRSEGTDDPESGIDKYFTVFLKAGYNVVRPGYAFAPEYTYPTAIHQVSQAINYLKENADEYKLDMKRVIIGGNSAGAQLAGQFINIQTNSSYAEQMHIRSVLPTKCIKAAIFNSGLLDCERFGKVNSILYSYLFTKCGQAYFSCRRLKGNANVIESGVINHITGDFPPTFISDGNKNTFTQQAIDLAKKMTELGVSHVLQLYSTSTARLSHDFERVISKQSDETLCRIVEFLEKIQW